VTAPAKPFPIFGSIASRPAAALPWVVAAIAFAFLFSRPAQLLVNDWWNNPEAGHGLLLAPIAIWQAWKRGLREDRKASIAWGIAILLGAVLLRYLSGLAAEVFTMRMSMVGALAGLVVFAWGWKQLLHWWLPFALLALSVPWPALITTTLALPLQFQASKMGAALLELRDIPVRLSGNVIALPGHQLFVTEACSGLRSLTALTALGVMVGGLWLRHPVSRVVLLLLAIPVAILINAVRVFFTGFLVYFVDPKLGEGFMHMTEGWLLFVVAFGILGLLAWAASGIENRFTRRNADA
jgi:exosortase